MPCVPNTTWSQWRLCDISDVENHECDCDKTHFDVYTRYCCRESIVEGEQVETRASTPHEKDGSFKGIVDSNSISL